MDFICEEEPNNTFDDQYMRIEDTWYESSCDEPEEPVRDIPSMQCQEAMARKSDLQLACQLDLLANSLRSGAPPKFNDEASVSCPGQSLNEFLSVLERRLLEKTQSQEENDQDVVEPDCQLLCKNMRTPSHPHKMRRKRSPVRRLNFSNVSARPGPSTTRSRMEPPSSPDWKAMLNDSNEIVCYPSERLNMYGMTAGDIWKRRAEGKPSCSRKCPSPPSTPVRQVQAIPVRCVPSPKFDLEESLLSMSDINRPEYCGCTVEEILRKKAKNRAKTFLDASYDDLPSWHHRQLDDSSFFKSKRHHLTRKPSPSRKKCSSFMEDREPVPDFIGKCKGFNYRQVSPEKDPLSKKLMTCSQWLSKSRSNSSMCSCCDELPQRVAEWTESQFKGQSSKGVGTGIDCGSLMVKKPMLKKKPIMRTKNLRVTFPDSNQLREGGHFNCRLRCCNPRR